jgi:universal stress protein A
MPRVVGQIAKENVSMSFTHILVAVDFSTQANAALTVALREAELHHASVTLLHVLQHHTHTEVTYIRGNPENQRGLAAEFGSLQPLGRQEPVVLRRDYLEETLTHLRDLVPQSFTGKWEVEVASGDPADGIIHVAREHGIDLIVMGTHGRTGLAHVFLGSVAEKVVRHAPCPVLVTRA